MQVTIGPVNIFILPDEKQTWLCRLLWIETDYFHVLRYSSTL